MTVDITYCREVEPSVYEREVEISVFDRVFCIAKSLVVSRIFIWSRPGKQVLEI